MNQLIYSLEITFCLGLFYGIYRLFLAQLGFHSWNRAYILGALFASIIIPSLSIQFPTSSIWKKNVAQPLSDTYQMESMVIYNLDDISAEGFQTESSPSTSYVDLLFYIAMVGWFFFGFRYVYNIWHLFLLARGGQREGTFIIKTLQNNQGHSSFLNCIFMSSQVLSKEEYQQVLEHEKHHYYFKHSWDMLFVGLYQVVFWFNPFVYTFRKSLILVHEYQVDARMSQTWPPKKYAALLLKLSQPSSSWLAHQIGQHPIQLRIHQLFNQYSNPMKKLFYILVLPVVVFACQQFGMPHEADFALPGTPMANAKHDSPDSLRTKGGNLGENPVVMIDGKKYPASILKRINPWKVSSSSTNRSFGSDGSIEIETKNGDFSFDSHEQWLSIMAIEHIPGDQFFIRMSIVGEDNKKQDYLQMGYNTKTHGSMTVDPGEQVTYIINEKVLSEQEVIDLDRSVTLNLNMIMVNKNPTKEIQDKYGSEIIKVMKMDSPGSEAHKALKKTFEKIPELDWQIRINNPVEMRKDSC